MSKIENQVNPLLSCIKSAQQRINQLINQEFQQNQESRELSYRLQQLENSYSNKNRSRNQLKHHHLKNMQYLNAKIQNHQYTLEKYKALYQNLNGQGSLNLINCATRRQQNQNFINIPALKANNSAESVIASKISVSKRDQPNFKQNQSITIISEIQCQMCGYTFKPYSYYKHLQNCCPKNMFSAKLSSSYLVE